MKKLFLPFLSLIFNGCLLEAQNNLTVNQCFGGSNNDGANNIQITPDGGYIFAGFTTSSNGNVTGYHGDNVHNEIWVVKTDSDTTIQWQKCLGGTGGEIASQILLTNDGGYLVVGSTESDDGDVTQHFGGYDAWIVKLNDTGSITWQKSYGGSGNDYAYGAMQDYLGHYIIAGTTNSSDSGITVAGGYDGWVLDIDSAGNLLQQHTYGGAGNDALYNAFADSSGNYFFMGNTTSNDANIINHGGSDLWAVETDGINILQQACFGGDSDEYFYNAIKGSTGNFILVGGTYSYNSGQVFGSHGGEDAWMVQVDTFFDLISQADMGGSDNDYFTGVTEINNQLLIVGTTYSNDGTFSGMNHGDADMFLVQINQSTGEPEKINCYGGTLDDFGNAITANSGGAIYLCGTVTSNNTGTIAGNHGGQDAWVGKTQSHTRALPFADTSIVIAGIVEPGIQGLASSVFPNPSGGKFQIAVNAAKNFTGKMELLNSLGQTVASQAIRINDGMNTFDSPSNSIELAKGIYLVRITDNNGNGVVMKTVVQ